MHATAEEEVIVLYAIYCLGGAPTKASATEFILAHQYVKPRPNDNDIVATGETRIANRIAYARADLARKKTAQLTMPRQNVWKITTAGQERLFRIAKQAHGNHNDGLEMLDDIIWERFIREFMNSLRGLGAARIKFGL